MRNLFANHTIGIAAGRAVSGIADREQTLRVVCGKVWITVEGSPEDHWLSAGESVQIAPGRLVVIEAEREDSRVQVPEAAKRAFHLRDLALRLTHMWAARPI